MNYSANWFKYRLPGQKEAFGGCSDHLEEGIHEGFVISTFLNDKTFTIPKESELSDGMTLPVGNKELPMETSKEDYVKEVEAIKNLLDGKEGKTVAARCIKVEGKIDLSASFQTLCEKYPDAFVFMFHTEEGGTWIGATPELLLRKEKDAVTSYALAGTRPAGTEGDWDEKNVREQKMVEDFIYSTMRRRCMFAMKGKAQTLAAGPVEHICTRLTAVIETLAAPKQLLDLLSPTPAVCGSDREVSKKLIAEYEPYGREYYGGYCGPCYANGDLDLYVILRCAQVSDNGIRLYAGGGITPLSDPENEWIETELKASTLLGNIKTL